jgi:hypothetical protein
MSALERSPHFLIAFCRPDAWVLDAARLVVGTRDVERKAVFVDEDVTEQWIHLRTRVIKGRLQITFRSDAIARCME